MSRDIAYPNHYVRMYHNQLADIVALEHRYRCPCCGHTMVTPRRDTPANNRRRDLRTVAHDKPVGFGGDPRIWVYACQGCNTNQAGLSFRSWSLLLRHRGDRRAAAVAALADRIDNFLERNT